VAIAGVFVRVVMRRLGSTVLVLWLLACPAKAQYGLVREIESPTKAPFGRFGEAIAWVDEASFLVGAYQEQSAYVYGLDGALRLTIPNPDPSRWKGFGWQVATVGDRLAVSCWPNDGDKDGAVFIYDCTF
jgi:hypothetical protein